MSELYITYIKRKAWHGGGKSVNKDKEKNLCLDQFWDRILEQSRYNELMKEYNLYLSKIF